MKKTLSRLVLAAGLGLGLPTAAQAALFAASPQDLAAEAAAAAKDGKRLAVLLKLGDCGSCERMAREVFSRPATEREFARRYRGVTVDLAFPAPLVMPDGRRETPADWAQRLKVVAAPAFVFLEPDGSLRYRFQGELSDADFLRLARYVADAGYEDAPFRPSRNPRRGGGDVR